MRLTRASVAALALAITAGCGTASAAPQPVTATQPAKASQATPSPRNGHGELAYVAYGKLYLRGGPAGGPAGAPHRVTLPGLPYAPAWSADGRWLAVQVSSPPPASQPFLQQPATLWLVNAAGTSARRITPASWQVSGFAWAPHRDELAVAAYLPKAPPARADLAATLTPAGQYRILAAGQTLTGPAWSPDGTRLAVGTATFTAGQWHSRLDLLSPSAGTSAVAATNTGNVLELAGWWPDGHGLLYWTDYQGSASIAADGLPLDAIALGSRSPRTLLPAMLVHASWLAPAPRGRAFAAVAGGDRVIWSGGKQITLCAPAGRCTPVRQPAGVVSVGPSWSPGGSAIVFARLSASGPFGPGGHADFTPSWITRWEATSTLWTAPAPAPAPVAAPGSVAANGSAPATGPAPAPGSAATGSAARLLTAAGRGAHDPVWGRDGSVLFVRADSLWLLPPRAAAPIRLTGPLGVLSGPAFDQTYYGYVPYPQLFAWTLS
ncbi:MAG TPA: hypothetical protein VKU77_36000 [Streptosporangiaceae bacterium]|nr:hypothetical protein [Streptosporangiaceae bacterium]